MSGLDYNALMGWEAPSNENGADKGYLVHDLAADRTTWVPEYGLSINFKQPNGLTFGEAIELIRLGEKVSRKGWNSKGMFLFLVPGSTFKVNRPPLLGIYEEGTEINYQPHIDMRTADGTIVPWLASQSDILSVDWELV